MLPSGSRPRRFLTVALAAALLALLGASVAHAGDSLGNPKPATFSNSGYTAPAVERWDVPNVPGGLPSNAMASYEQPAAGATGAKSATPSEQAEWVAQQIAIAPGASVSRFLWDVNHALPQLALERDANNGLIRSYSYGARRISQTAGSDTSYFLYDGLGSVANLTSSSGATQWTWSYEPFGSVRTEEKAAGAQPQNFMRFTGEYLEPSGLYHGHDSTTPQPGVSWLAIRCPSRQGRTRSRPIRMSETVRPSSSIRAGRSRSARFRSVKLLRRSLKASKPERKQSVQV